MTLEFVVQKEEALAFTQQYLLGSKSHQNTRLRIRFMLPCIMLGLILFTSISRGRIEIPSIIIYGGAAVLWFCFYTYRFDSNVLKEAKKQMKESSYEKTLGAYRITLTEEGIDSTSDLGSGTYKWKGVDRVEMTDEYLFIFLSGALGYPIRISEIGQSTATEAYQLISDHIEQDRL